MNVRSLVKILVFIALGYYPLSKASPSNCGKEVAGIQHVPNEILHEIINYLPPKQRLAVARVDKRFAEQVTRLYDQDVKTLGLGLQKPSPLSRSQFYQEVSKPSLILSVLHKLERATTGLKLLYQPSRLESLKNCLGQLRALGHQPKEKMISKPTIDDPQIPQLLDDLDRTSRELRNDENFNWPTNMRTSPSLAHIIEKILATPSREAWNEVGGTILCPLQRTLEMTDFKTGGIFAHFLQHTKIDARRFAYHFLLDYLYTVSNPMTQSLEGVSPALPQIAAWLREEALNNSDPVIYVTGLTYQIMGKSLSTYNAEFNRDYLFYLEPVDEGFLPKYVSLIVKWDQAAR